MTIKIKDYRIKVSPLAPAFFDLYKVGINQKGNNIGETYERSIAHGTTLGRCVEIIAGLENIKLEKDVEMHEFLIDYEKLLEEHKIRIINQIKEKTNE